MGVRARRRRTATREGVMAEKVVKSDAEWRRQLSSQQYYVTRQKGTERAFTGEYWNTKTKGTYCWVCCGQPLFSSDTKFDSGTGWPSFWDNRALRPREIAASSPGAPKCCAVDAMPNLGHVFHDGPAPTGLRYCMNSAD